MVGPVSVGFFDSVNRQRLMGRVGTRIGDGVVLRLLSKWLHAGVMEAGQLQTLFVFPYARVVHSIYHAKP
jgi:hypothetical protein